MCVPYSVRIQMKRLKSLVESYEKDTCYRESIGLPKLSYTAWAKHEAKRIKKDQNKKSNGKEEESALDALELPTAYNKSISVEVTKEIVISKKSGRKFKREECNEWRLAKRARPGAFVQNADVICLITCDDTNGGSDVADGKEYEFFIGNVVKVSDGYVRVHFTGLAKKEDQWFEQDSEHLFLDGGETEAPLSDDEDETLEQVKAAKAKGVTRQKKRSRRSKVSVWK